MAITYNMQAPNGLVGQQYQVGVPAGSGTVYTTGANGLITGVAGPDVDQMLKFGCRMLPQAGSGTGTLNTRGNLYSTVNLATSLSPSATGSDYVLAVLSIPANTLDGLGNNQRVIRVNATGQFGATANNKRVKLYWNPTAAVVGSTVNGGTIVADTSTCTASGVGWAFKAVIAKAGAPNSNTQVAQAELQTINVAGGTVVPSTGLPVFPTATENAAILVAIVGNAGTTASDVNLNTFCVAFEN